MSGYLVPTSMVIEWPKASTVEGIIPVAILA